MKNRRKMLDQLNEMKTFFIIIPVKIIKDPLLSNNAKLLFTILVSQSEAFNPNITFLCNAMNLSKPVVQKAIRELMSRNIIVRTKRGFRGYSSLYQFSNPTSWIIKGLNEKQPKNS